MLIADITERKGGAVSSPDVSGQNRRGTRSPARALKSTSLYNAESIVGNSKHSA
jgi:hypothetical protein